MYFYHFGKVYKWLESSLLMHSVKNTLCGVVLALVLLVSVAGFALAEDLDADASFVQEPGIAPVAGPVIAPSVSPDVDPPVTPVANSTNNVAPTVIPDETTITPPASEPSAAPTTGRGRGRGGSSIGSVVPLSTTPSPSQPGDSSTAQTSSVSSDETQSSSAPITGFAVGGLTKRSLLLVGVFLLVIAGAYAAVQYRKKNA